MKTYRVQLVKVVHQVYEQYIEAEDEEHAIDAMRDTYFDHEPIDEFTATDFIHEVEEEEGEDA